MMNNRMSLHSDTCLTIESQIEAKQGPVFLAEEMLIASSLWQASKCPFYGKSIAHIEKRLRARRPGWPAY